MNDNQKSADSTKHAELATYVFSRPKTAILLLTVLLCIACNIRPVNSQIPTGAWRDHLPYRHAKRLAEAGNQIFCATSDGSLFSYDKVNNQLHKYSKIDGLSDAEISTIGYSYQDDILVIAYSNGNIDLVRNDSIYNIPDIKRKLFTGDKSINIIFFLEHKAYLACGFGIVVCDLNRKEIKESYFIGEGGSQIRVNDIAFDGQFLYAATTDGIYKADLYNSNLVDYSSWSRLQGVPDTQYNYMFLTFLDNRLYTVFNNTQSGFDEIITVSDLSWETWSSSFNDHFTYLGSQSGYLVICSLLSTRLYYPEGKLVRQAVTYYATHALLDKQNTLWYADPQSGLIRLDEDGRGQIFVPDGPAYREVGDMEVLSGHLWAAGGTEAFRWAGYGAYSFIGERWTDYNANEIPELKDFLNISEITIDPKDPGHVIGGSYGYGLAEFRNGILVDIIDESDGILQPVPGYGHGYVLVKGLCFDGSGNLWVSTTLSDQPVYKRNADGQWTVMDFTYPGFGQDTRTGDIYSVSWNQQWLLVERNGLLVFTEENGEVKEERFFPVQNQAGHLLDRVYCIAEDKDGNVWVGTNKGPVIFFNVEGIFGEETIIGYQPEIPRNDGSSFVDFLLATEKINSIAVDGANQKWLATEKSGVFLVSPDGKSELAHFNEENSPLFSNNVQSVAVNDKTGEVFFGTDRGIQSFRGRATEGSEDFSNVYVFPNPVRENYFGEIIITGLVSDVNVKITDISGNLIYETTSLGGQAIWNGRTFNGERVFSGIYLIFCTNSDGSKTIVTKVLFIH